MTQPKSAADEYRRLKREFAESRHKLAWLGSMSPDERDLIMTTAKRAEKALDEFFFRLIELRTRAATR